MDAITSDSYHVFLESFHKITSIRFFVWWKQSGQFICAGKTYGALSDHFKK